MFNVYLAMNIAQKIAFRLMASRAESVVNLLQSPASSQRYFGK